MNKYHIITLILCLFCLGGAATASPDRTAAAPDTQARSSQLKVSGIIKDDAGSPLIGVTIVVKGTSSGSVSNSDGSYTITVPYAEATLMVSYIGYAPQEIGVNNRTRIDITMVEDSKALEEVVVVGYNVQKKETITGSISTITTKDLKQSPTANINNALAGRMPGLLVNQFNGGEPGNDAAQLNIRGKSTYGKSDVIMIVDGIERDMSYLSPDEIETFTILKDASATAPYGIRGANGVIIVTTKRGRKGEKPTVDSRRRWVSANRSATPTTWVRQAMRPSTTRRCSTTTPRWIPARHRSSPRRRSATSAAPRATTPTAWATTGITSTTHSNRRSSRITAFRYEAAPTAPVISSSAATTTRAATTSIRTPTTSTSSCAITSAPTSMSTPPSG